MNREDIVMFCVSDIAGKARGKGFPARDLEKRLEQGVGWTPTNIMITAFSDIADTPWGPRGDLVLVPVREAEVKVDFGDGSVPEHFFLCEVQNTDGTPWECCLRRFLKGALDDLRRETGLRIFSAFEHEFHYDGAEKRLGDAYALDAFRTQGLFASVLLYALRAAGIEPDSFLPEYGAGQYEVTCTPSEGAAAADTAVVLRELAQAAARRLGHRVSFSPLVTGGSATNGVHVHFSLLDGDGRPVAYDPKAPFGLSEIAGRFVAGILKHMPALCAFTAASVVSYERLKPNQWSPTCTNLGYRDREACVRICPVLEQPGAEVASRYNLEFRAADGCASPYLVLGALVHAGLEGIRQSLPAPRPTTDDPEKLSPAERAERGIARLPRSLEEALETLERDATACAWFPDALLDAYLRHKRGEIALVKDLDLDARIERYGEAY
jgi:glutamine synthetase